MKYFLIALVLCASGFTVNAQLNNNIKAKLYFTEAQKLYKQGDFESSLKYVEKAENTLNQVVARTLALKIQIEYNLGNFITAEKLLNLYASDYMSSASEELNNEVLALFINIEEAAQRAKAENDYNKRFLENTGTFIDTRDRTTYRTIIIGDQEWMAENLNFWTKEGSWCYENQSANCEKFGRLYDHKHAVKSCPNGWRLPTSDDFKELVSQFNVEEEGGKPFLKGGESYFSALLSGYYFVGTYYPSEFDRMGEDTIFWSSTDWFNPSGNSPDAVSIWPNSVRIHNSHHETDGLSVRCIKS